MNGTAIAGYLKLFPHVLVTLDGARCIAAVNDHACRLFGSSAQELRGRPFLDVAVATDDGMAVARALDELPTPDDARRPAVAFTCKTPSRPARSLAWRCLRVDDAVLCAGEDVTDDLRREAVALESQARLTNVARFATMGELAAGIAHELNQPLAAIANYARAAQRFLERPEPDMKETKLALEEVASEALRAGAIIHRLRRLIDAQRREREPADVNDLIEDLQHLTGADARAHDTRLTFDLRRPLPRVLIDPAELQHVLLNLTRNALEALSAQVPANREICFSTRLDKNGEVVIAVADNGPGVSNDMVATMFDAFSTSKPGGTGLGLAIGRSLVNSNGGRLEFDPVLPHGAVFRIHLPATEEPVA